LFAEMEEVIRKYKPADMVTDKIIGRVGIVGMTGGITRTTVFGSMVFSAVYAPIVGISKETLLQVVSDLYDITEKNPATPEAKAAYAETNAKFQAAQKVVDTSVKDLGFDGLDESLVLSPMPKLKQ